MKILYISPRIPYPLEEGNKVVIFNHLRYLSKGNQITLLVLYQHKKELKDLDELKKYCYRLEAFKRRGNLSILNFLLSLFSSRPYTVARYYSFSFAKRFRLLLESGRFDVVHIAYYYMGQYLSYVDPNKIPAQTLLVIDTHNIEHILYRRYSDLCSNIFLKIFLFVESARLRRYEAGIYKRFHRCFVFTEPDKRRLNHICPSARVCVHLPPIETKIEFSRYHNIREQESTLLFYGRLRYFANEDAVRFFYWRVFPLVKKKFPNVKFRIVGGYATKYLRGLSRNRDVELLGYVEDIVAEIKRSTLVVVPLRMGGGIRIKILTAWLSSKAVISTSVGAEGLPYSDGDNIAIADEPGDFAEKIIWLLKNPRLRHDIGCAGYEVVKNKFDPEELVGDILRCYADARRLDLLK